MIGQVGVIVGKILISSVIAEGVRLTINKIEKTRKLVKEAEEIKQNEETKQLIMKSINEIDDKKTKKGFFRKG